jgi:hypothetical protein
MRSFLRHLSEAFVDKRDPSGRGSMKRLIAAAFTAALCYRLITIPERLGPWDAVVILGVVFALCLYEALDNASPREVLHTLTSILRRPSDSPSDPPAG